jgi:hypothetical protein
MERRILMVLVGTPRWQRFVVGNHRGRERALIFVNIDGQWFQIREMSVHPWQKYEETSVVVTTAFDLELRGVFANSP